MKNKPIAIVTGATNGMGQLVALELAKKGMDIGFTARSLEKAKVTKQLIHAVAPQSDVKVFMSDFTVLKDVQRTGKEIADTYDHIDVLINNAGVHAFEQRVTADGFSEMIQVNYLAPWILTNMLRKTLVASGKARVVTVASEASKRHGTFSIPFDLTNTAAFGMRESSELYGKTKLLDIMFCLELAHQLKDTSVTSNCLNPGFNVTGLGRDLKFAGPLEKILTKLHVGDPSKGAGIIVALATNADLEKKTGRYYSGKELTELVPSHPADSEASRQQLWERTGALLAEHGIKNLIQGA